MKVFVKLKSAGKRRPVLDNSPYELAEDIRTVAELIADVVKKEVAAYNDTKTGMQLFQWMTEKEIGEQAEIGKVGFGARYNEKNVEPEQAVETALTAYKDGLFKIFAGERELGAPSDPAGIVPGEVLTFIRFTFLSGSLIF